MIFPTVPCQISWLLLEKDDYGNGRHNYPITAYCSVVKLSDESKSTSVRADSSASRGNAREILSDARLLFKPNIPIKIGDRVEIHGFKLEVSSVRPRFEVSRNKIDHWQVDLQVWA